MKIAFSNKYVQNFVAIIQIGIAIGIEELWHLDTRNWMSIVFR